MIKWNYSESFTFKTLGAIGWLRLVGIFLCYVDSVGTTLLRGSFSGLHTGERLMRIKGRCVNSNWLTPGTPWPIRDRSRCASIKQRYLLGHSWTPYSANFLLWWFCIPFSLSLRLIGLTRCIRLMGEVGAGKSTVRLSFVQKYGIERQN